MRSFARRRFEGIEVASLDCTGHAFPPHYHDEFVLSVNTRGQERIRLDRKALEAGERHITLYNPAQVQSSTPLDNEWRFLSLYVEPGFLRKAFDLPTDTVFDRPVLTHDDAAKRMAASIRRCLSVELPEGEALEGLIETLDELLNLAGSRRTAVGGPIPPAVHRVADRLRTAVPPPSLSELAREVGLTPVQLLRAFTSVYGLPPLAWATNNRLNAARQRLRGGEAIARIAADLGFADQAHMTRRFRAMHGVPPGLWRQG